VYDVDRKSISMAECCKGVTRHFFSTSSRQSLVSDHTRLDAEVKRDAGFASSSDNSCRQDVTIRFAAKALKLRTSPLPQEVTLTTVARRGSFGGRAMPPNGPRLPRCVVISLLASAAS